MKYKDKHTHLLNYKFNKTTSGQNTVEIYRKKLIKQFSKEVLKSGFDPDWWSLVSRDEKYHLLLNWNLINNGNIHKNTGISANYTITELPEQDCNSRLYQFILSNKPKIDQSKFRDIKLNRVLK